VEGARQLSSSLNELAQYAQATPDDPLTVNFVAHSHGGNVVLEALLHLNTNVRVGRLALLGTPLVTVRPAFGIARLISSVVLPLFFFSPIYTLIQLGKTILVGHFDIPVLAARC